MVQAGAVEDQAAGALRSITVGAPETSSDHRKSATLPGHEIFKVRCRLRPHHRGGRRRSPAPTSEELAPEWSTHA